MKNIINCALYLLLVSVLLINVNSCGNEAIDEVQDQQDNVTIEYYTEYQARTTGIHYTGEIKKRAISDDGPEPDCPHEDCSTAIPAMAVILQQIANENCQEAWNCIACCMDNQITYALMYATPQSPPCPGVAVK